GVDDGAVTPGELDDAPERLDRAHLVVRPHDGDERRAPPARGEDGVELVEVDDALLVDAEPVNTRPLVRLQPHARLEDGRVLDGADDDLGAPRLCGPPAEDEALDGEVVRLRAAGGEDDLPGLGAERGGDRLPGL